MEPINGILPESLWTFLAVLLGLCLLFVTLGSVVDTFKKLRKPSKDTRDDIDTKLHRDKERLDNHAAQIDELKESSKIQCAALIALLDHQLHNGNSAQMQKARDDLNEYLINKG